MTRDSSQSHFYKISVFLMDQPTSFAPVVYRYRNFVILIQSEPFSSTPISNPYPKKNYGLQYPNPKPLNQLHISQCNWYCLFCLMRQKPWLFCLLSDKRFWSGPMTSKCYRQVLPITTITVQKPSLLKASQTRIQTNRFKRIISNQNPSFNQLTPKSCHKNMTKSLVML